MNFTNFNDEWWPEISRACRCAGVSGAAFEIVSVAAAPYCARVIRNVILDWSGTVVDDLPAVWQATNEVLVRAGLPEFTLERFRAEFRLPFEDFYQECAAPVPLEQLEIWFHECFQRRSAGVTELPYAREFLEFCQGQRLRTFVLSTIHRDYFHAQAAHLGFEGYFEQVYLGVRDKRERIGVLLREQRLAPPDTLLVGDMQHDVETARQGGVFACAVLTGYNSIEQLRASRPNLIVEHLGELRRILERHRLDLEQHLESLEAKEARLPVATVGGLIFNETGQVLMVRTRKWSNLWGIPGGKIRFGETAEAALQREVREETDLEIDQIEFVMVQDCVSSPEFYRDEHFLLLNYLARSGGGDVRLNTEAQEFRWAKLEEALALRLNQPTRILIERVMRERHG